MAANEEHDGTQSAGMSQDLEKSCRYFATYTGLRLPLNLISPIAPEALANRNTYIRAAYDEKERLIGFRKFVYGDVELIHRYRYHDSGAIALAEIVVPGEDAVVLRYDEAGRRLRRTRPPAGGVNDGHTEG